MRRMGIKKGPRVSRGAKQEEIWVQSAKQEDEDIKRGRKRSGKEAQLYDEALQSIPKAFMETKFRARDSSCCCLRPRTTPSDARLRCECEWWRASGGVIAEWNERSGE